MLSEKAIVYFDMDGVLTNFPAAVRKLGLSEKNLDDKDWEKIDSKGEKFWANMGWMPGAKALLANVTKHWKRVELLSGRSIDPVSVSGKKKWISRNVDIPATVTWTSQKPKKAVRDSVKNVLIDDNPDTCKKWKEAGGIAILHSSIEETKKKLRKLGVGV